MWVTPDGVRVRVRVGADGGALMAPVVSMDVNGGTRETGRSVENRNFQYIVKEHSCWLTS